MATIPATDRRPERRPLTVTCGVTPRRPHVRPRRPPGLFYLRPGRLLPRGNGLLVTLGDPPRGDLRAEAEPVHQPGRTRDAVGDVELPADQRGHPRRGPHLILRPAVLGRTLLQIPGEFLQAARRQTTPAPARSPRKQLVGAALSPQLLPLVCRLQTHTQLPGHLGRLDLLSEQLRRLHPHRFPAPPCRRRQPAPIRISHTPLTTDNTTPTSASSAKITLTSRDQYLWGGRFRSGTCFAGSYDGAPLTVVR
jgi:hypothetical protein